MHLISCLVVCVERGGERVLCTIIMYCEWKRKNKKDFILKIEEAKPQTTIKFNVHYDKRPYPGDSLSAHICHSG